MDSVLQTVKFPTCIAHLYASLTDVNRYAFPLEKKPKNHQGEKTKQIMPFITPMTNANPKRSVYYMWRFLDLNTVMNLLSSFELTRLKFHSSSFEIHYSSAAMIGHLTEVLRMFPSIV